MDARDVANQAWRYIVATGRIGAEGEKIVAAMGEESFLDQAAAKWEADGRPRFIEGMKRIMLDLIWSSSD